jgi:hypothetical protein
MTAHPIREELAEYLGVGVENGGAVLRLLHSLGLVRKEALVFGHV